MDTDFNLKPCVPKGKAKEYKSVIMPKPKINFFFSLSKFYRQLFNAGQALVSGIEERTSRHRIRPHEKTRLNRTQQFYSETWDCKGCEPVTDDSQTTGK